MDSARYPRLSLDLLRGFHAAARHLSFTRAATELYVTQPAISRGIKALEEQLGQPLFRRANRTLQLTSAGEELYRCTNEVFALIESSVRRLAGSDGALSVTTSVPFASLWLGPRLPRFTKLHPDIDLRIVANNSWSNLDREQLDIAIRFAPKGKTIPEGEWLVDYRTFPICAPALLNDSSRSLRTPAELARHVILDFETTIDGRPWSDWAMWFDAMHMRAVRASGLLRFSHYDQLIQAAVDGGGVAIGKWPHIANHLRGGALRAPFGGDLVASLGSFSIVVPPASTGRDDVALFVAWLKEETRRDVEELPGLVFADAPDPGRRRAPNKAPPVANAKRRCG